MNGDAARFGKEICGPTPKTVVRIDRWYLISSMEIEGGYVGLKAIEGGGVVLKLKNQPQRQKL